MSTKARIIEYLRSSGRISGSQLEKQADNWGTKPSVISRRARELAHEGVINRELVKHGKQLTVQYSLNTHRNLNVQEANQFLKDLSKQEALL